MNYGMQPNVKYKVYVCKVDNKVQICAGYH